jgi:hypothetical protein
MGAWPAIAMKTLPRLVLVILATLVLTELGYRGFRAWAGQVPPHPDPSVAAEWDWAQEHLALGTANTASHVRHDPDLGWRVQAKVRPAVGGPKVRRKRTPGVPRVVFTGDSFMRELGWLGPTFQPEWEVINLAVQGYGAGQAWLRFRQRAAKLQPDVAVFGLYLRDYFRVFRSFRSYAKPTFALGPDGEVVVGNVPVIAPEALYEAYVTGERTIGLPHRSYVVDVIGERWNLYQRQFFGIDEAQFALFAAILRSFRDDARAVGACPLLLIFPTRPEDYDGTVYEEIDRRTRALADELGLPRVALAEALYDGASDAERLALFNEGHGAHMSEHGRAEAVRVLHEAFDALVPATCRPDRAGDGA